MNRRQALKRVSLLIVGVGISKVIYHVFDFAKKPSLQKLDADKNKINSLVNTILPENQDPDQIIEYTTNFVIKMVKYCTKVNAQKRFINGLEDLDENCLASFSSNFIDCTKEEKLISLKILEENHYSNNYHWRNFSSRILGEPFIITLKRYAIMGYCTSQVGATNRLRYDELPGAYRGCTSLSVVGNNSSWVTR